MARLLARGDARASLGRLLIAGLLATSPLLAQDSPAAAAGDDDAKPAVEHDPWVVYAGDPADGDRPGAGKHVVFVTGDEEYRSEEGMPQLARILAVHHGFTCTVLFSIDGETGVIDPEVPDNIPGLERLANADLLVVFTRFRDLPDEQMKHVVDYVESGRPILGLRTATHAFRFEEHETYRDWTFNARGKRPGGFGKQVLGETWVAHHGAHGRQSSRGVAAPGQADHAILRGIEPGTIWDPSDVYTVRLPMADGIEPIVLGEVLAGMSPDDPPAPARENKKRNRTIDKNDPMMPVAWTKAYRTASGKDARVFTTTLGASQAFLHAGTRRLLVNACYWALELEDRIDPESSVDLVGTYEPTRFGFGKHRPGVRPHDLRWPR